MPLVPIVSPNSRATKPTLWHEQLKCRHINTFSLKIHNPRDGDWKMGHQGHNPGIMVGGIIAFVCLVLGGLFMFSWWRKRRLSSPSEINLAEIRPIIVVNSSVTDPFTGEHWRPSLYRISEHEQETSVLSIQKDRFSEENEIYETPSVHPTVGIPSQRQTSPPDVSYRPNEAQYAEEREEFLPPPPDMEWRTRDYNPSMEEETPNLSPTDSDSLQVNIPWRDSIRFTPRPELLDLPSTPPPRDEQDTIPHLSSLHIRAMNEEERRLAQQSAPNSAENAHADKRDSVEDAVTPHGSEGSGPGSTLPSFAKLKLKLTGSAPFLPLIEESSPLDTESLWARFASRSRTISLKTVSTASHGRPRSSQNNVSPSKSSNKSIASLSTSVPRPSISIISSSAFVPPPSFSHQPASPLKSPPQHFSPDESNIDRIQSQTHSSSRDLRHMMLTPETGPVISPLSNASPWQTHSSLEPLTYSSPGGSDLSTSSFALQDLATFPEPPSTSHSPPSFIRPLPKRPLPPPPTYHPPQPPIETLPRRRELPVPYSGSPPRVTEEQLTTVDVNTTQQLDTKKVASEVPGKLSVVI
ncbi:hypothetical protein BU17DRAFT_95626 [Hysterangium stoloniferum]|nr:hypothetical protein BU17DRAFT_95626 [Hysterangium stoloniferum]